MQNVRTTITLPATDYMSLKKLAGGERKLGQWISHTVREMARKNEYSNIRALEAQLEEAKKSFPTTF